MLSKITGFITAAFGKAIIVIALKYKNTGGML
jgi:hypothetical protein